MQTYTSKKLMRVTLPLFDFGGGAAEVFSFRLPEKEDGSSTRGQIVSIGVSITEVFLTGLTEGSVAVGTAADADAFALLNIPTAAADVDCIDQTDDTDAIIAAAIPADTLVQVTLTNGTDSGSVTGQGIPYIDILTW